MGQVIIQDYTTKIPLEMMGVESAICMAAPTDNADKNVKRGLSCVESMHGRVEEFPDIYMILDGYSARAIREFYTHIGGSPTRLQESTRYGLNNDSDYNFDWVTPPDILENEEKLNKYNSIMQNISLTIKELEGMGVNREDATMLLPLGMKTKVVVKMNFRTFVNFCHQRLCKRAFWEIREMCIDIIHQLSKYSPQWKTLVCLECVPKCYFLKRCPEKKSCGWIDKTKGNLEELN